MESRTSGLRVSKNVSGEKKPQPLPWKVESEGPPLSDFVVPRTPKADRISQMTALSLSPLLWWRDA